MAVYVGDKKQSVGFYITTDRCVLSKAEYEALEEKSPSVMYMVYDDPTLEELETHIKNKEIHVTVEEKERWNNPISIPTGLISLWSGSSDSIPEGWILCDGENGTPDLRDRFIMGAGNTYEAGTSGGSVPTLNSQMNNISGGGSNVNYMLASNGQQLPPYYALCYIMKL